MTSAASDSIFMGLCGCQKRPSHDIPHNVGNTLAASASRLPTAQPAHLPMIR